jgi:hypothetical protein
MGNSVYSGSVVRASSVSAWSRCAHPGRGPGPSSSESLRMMPSTGRLRASGYRAARRRGRSARRAARRAPGSGTGSRVTRWYVPPGPGFNSTMSPHWPPRQPAAAAGQSSRRRRLAWSAAAARLPAAPALVAAITAEQFGGLPGRTCKPVKTSSPAPTPANFGHCHGQRHVPRSPPGAPSRRGPFSLSEADSSHSTVTAARAACTVRSLLRAYCQCQRRVPTASAARSVPHAAARMARSRAGRGRLHGGLHTQKKRSNFVSLCPSETPGNTHTTTTHTTT